MKMKIRDPILCAALIVLSTGPGIGPGPGTAYAQPPQTEAYEHRSLLAAINFEGASAKPAPFSAAALDSVAPLVKKAKDRRYEVHGFSCSDASGGDEEGNKMRASAERVEAMVKYLSKNRVAAANIVTIIHGAAPNVKSKSVAESDCARVEIIAVETRQREVIPEPKPDPESLDMADFRSKLESESGEGSDPNPDPESEPKPESASVSMSESTPPPDLAPTPADSQGRPTIAIYMAGEEPPAVKGAHYVLGGELARTISESDKYLAVDRTEDIQSQIAKEHVYQREGGVDDDQIKELGMQLGAQFLCIGNIKDVGKKSYYLDVRLVDVVTAEIKRTVTANSSLKDANEKTRIAKEIAYELIETDKARAARRLKKKIFLFTGIGLDALGVGALAYGYLENNNVVKNSDKGFYGEGERNVVRRNVGYIVGGALIVSGVTVHILF